GLLCSFTSLHRLSRAGTMWTPAACKSLDTAQVLALQQSNALDAVHSTQFTRRNSLSGLAGLENRTDEKATGAAGDDMASVSVHGPERLHSRDADGAADSHQGQGLWRSA